MKALKIRTNFKTGARAGDINPKDPNLLSCSEWQSSKDGLEIRLVDDGDIEKFRGLDGVEILEGEATIEAEVAKIQRVRYVIKSEHLMMESIRQKNIDLTPLKPEMEMEEVAEYLFKQGALGIRRRVPEPSNCCDLKEARRARMIRHGRRMDRLGPPVDRGGDHGGNSGGRPQ